MAVRLVDTIDSEASQPGQTFHATLDSPLAVEGETALPSGYDVEGHIVNVQSAGKFAGQSLLVLQLDRISAGEKPTTSRLTSIPGRAARAAKTLPPRWGPALVSEPSLARSQEEAKAPPSGRQRVAGWVVEYRQLPKVSKSSCRQRPCSISLCRLH